ncbi:L,D-transpeptidase [Candidatus Peregrinibacteria bacterium]|nr:L,D-transpeptidase [Candidatus Peregrinibacteria bacterium]
MSFSHASFSQKVFAAEVLESVPSLIQGSEILAWHPQKDDRMEVDLTQNRGYLIHPNGERFSFDVATGQKRYVYYIGLYYFAATPVRLWEVASMDIKDDRVTFGKTGRFFRLNFQGGRTAYGIHGYNPEQWMFREGERYRSYGCIIVQEEVLDIIAATYILNEGHLRVETLETVHFFENLADSSLDDKDRLSNTLLEFFVESKKEFLDALPGSLSVVI